MDLVETITWIPVSERAPELVPSYVGGPRRSTVVLGRTDTRVAPVFLDETPKRKDLVWKHVCGHPMGNIWYWAPMPEGPVPG